MSLALGRVEARPPVTDLARANHWYAEQLGHLPTEERDGGLRYDEVTELRRRGVVFENYGTPGLPMSNNIVGQAIT